MAALKDRLVELARSDLALVAVTIALSLGILFWRLIFNEVLVPGDIPYMNEMWREEAAGRYTLPQNPLLSDQINQYYIWHSIAANSLQASGRFPLWNPYIFTGHPLVANAQSALFYPPNLLLFRLSPGQVASVRAIFNILIAGVFTFFFCRELRISRSGALLAAVSFAFSGPLIVWLGHTLGNVLACLPFLMWAGEKMLNQSRPALWGCMVGFGIGLSVLGGHPETTFHVMVVFGLYYLLRIVTGKRTFREMSALLGSLVLAVVMGFMVSGVQALPFADSLFQSSTLARGGRSMGGSSLLYSSEWLPNATTAITLLYPNFFGNPVTYNYNWPFSNFQNYNEQSIYFGLIPFALAVCAVASRKKHVSVILLAALALFCIGVAWRLPGFEFVNHSPLFSLVLNKRLKMIFTFLCTVLAGFGLDAFREYVVSGGRANRRGFWGIVAVFSLLAVPVLVIAVYKYIIVPRIGLPPEPFGYQLLFSVFSLRQVKTIIPVVVWGVALVGYLALLGRKSLLRVFEYLLVTLTLVELLVLAWGYNPTMKEADILPRTEAVDMLMREPQPFRIMETGHVFWPNYGAVYGLSDVAGLDFPVSRRYSALFRAQGGQVDYRQEWSPDWSLVDALNVRYILSAHKLDEAKLTLIYESRYFVYRNESALPRAYMVYNVEVIEDQAALLGRMLDDGFDFAHRVLLEQPLPAEKLDETPCCRDDVDFSVEFVEYETDRAVLDVFTEAPGILVMSDLFTPAWTAQVDRQGVPLYRANYTYRAVFVPGGRHQVVFSYQPLAFQIGAALSVLGLLATVVCGIFLGRHLRMTRA